jgi:hypothetical protein
MLRLARGTQRMKSGDPDVWDVLSANASDARLQSYSIAVSLGTGLILAILLGFNQDEPSVLAFIRGFGLQGQALLVLCTAVMPAVAPAVGCKTIKDVVDEHDEDDDDEEEEDGDEDGAAAGGVGDGGSKGFGGTLPRAMQGRPLSEEMAVVHAAIQEGAKPTTKKGLRQMVSKKKRRYQRNGYDLDLT